MGRNSLPLSEIQNHKASTNQIGGYTPQQLVFGDAVLTILRWIHDQTEQRLNAIDLKYTWLALLVAPEFMGILSLMKSGLLNYRYPFEKLHELLLRLPRVAPERRGTVEQSGERVSALPSKEDSPPSDRPPEFAGAPNPGKYHPKRTASWYPLRDFAVFQVERCEGQQHLPCSAANPAHSGIGAAVTPIRASMF
jgi:hypothetical protein